MAALNGPGRIWLRVAVAVVLPALVPAAVIAILWALPGDPVEILCPPGLCQGQAHLAERWGLAQGPAVFYQRWLAAAVSGDFGRSWRVQTGVPVAELLWPSWLATAQLVGLAFAGIVAASGVAAVVERWPRRLDALVQAAGLLPGVIGALLAAAWVELTYGAVSHEGWPGAVRLILGALVLAVSDGALAQAVVGTRGAVEGERQRRYVRYAVLRGESAIANMAPNVLPAWVAQLRGRLLHLLSGAVAVEVVLGLPGLGELLFDGTLTQDFGVVLAATWAFSLVSSALLLLHGLADAGIGLWVRREPLGLA